MEVAVPDGDIILIGRPEIHYEDETCILKLAVDIQKM